MLPHGSQPHRADRRDRDRARREQDRRRPRATVLRRV